MPTKHVSVDQMGVGRKAGGKHWTAREVEARQKAAEGVKRKTRAHMAMPDWLTPEAQKVWRRVRRQVKDLELLDNLDSEMLAIYCDAVVKYRETGERLRRVNDEERVLAVADTIKEMQAWARIVSAYAEKLGFTPAARARLVKKKADEIVDEFGSEFDG